MRRNTHCTCGLPGSTLSVTPQPGNASRIATANADDSRGTACAQASRAPAGASAGRLGRGGVVGASSGHACTPPPPHTTSGYGGAFAGIDGAAWRDDSGTSGSGTRLGQGVPVPGEYCVQVSDPVPPGPPGPAAPSPPVCVVST